MLRGTSSLPPLSVCNAPLLPSLPTPTAIVPPWPLSTHDELFPTPATKRTFFFARRGLSLLEGLPDPFTCLLGECPLTRRSARRLAL